MRRDLTRATTGFVLGTLLGLLLVVVNGEMRWIAVCALFGVAIAIALPEETR